MNWSPEISISEEHSWPRAVYVVRGRTSETKRYIPEKTCHTVIDDTGILLCSACGAVQPDDYTNYYCWSCGARVVDG